MFPVWVNTNKFQKKYLTRVYLSVDWVGRSLYVRNNWKLSSYLSWEVSQRQIGVEAVNKVLRYARLSEVCAEAGCGKEMYLSKARVPSLWGYFPYTCTY